LSMDYTASRILRLIASRHGFTSVNDVVALMSAVKAIAEKGQYGDAMTILSIVVGDMETPAQFTETALGCITTSMAVFSWDELEPIIAEEIGVEKVKPPISSPVVYIVSTEYYDPVTRTHGYTCGMYAVTLVRGEEREEEGYKLTPRWYRGACPRYVAEAATKAMQMVKEKKIYTRKVQSIDRIVKDRLDREGSVNGTTSVDQHI